MKRRVGILLAVLLVACPLGAGAQDARGTAGADKREETIRIQVNINLFFPGPTGESDDAVKLRERARRSIYQMAGSECAIVEQVIAKACRLESVNVNLNRQPGAIGGQGEGYSAGGNFAMRVTLK